MQSKRWLIPQVLICLVCAFVAPAPRTARAGLPPAPDAPAATTLTIKTASTSIAGCAAVRFEIWVNDVTDLYAADVHVLFDPAVVQVVDADPNAPGVQIEPVYTFLNPGFIIKRIACNVAEPGNADCPDAGKIWYSATQLNPSPPAVGSGPIAAFTLQGRSGGASALHFSYQQLSSPLGEPIPASPVDNSTTVTPLAAVQVSITRVNATTARLTWPASSGAVEYHIHRDSLPYFSPAEPPYDVTPTLQFDDPDALGSAAVEHYYIVKAACNASQTSTDSNRTGAFDFALVRGS